MLELKTIQRLSMQNICVILNLNYEECKELKKKDIIHMVNNNISIEEMVEYKHQQIQEELQQLKLSKPKKVQPTDEEIKRIRKEKNKEYFHSDHGKLALQKAQAKYYNKKRLKLLSMNTIVEER
jgi:hypothetical protein